MTYDTELGQRVEEATRNDAPGFALTLTPVQPSGTITVKTLHGPVTVDDFPWTEERKAFKARRRALDITLREAGRRLGLSGVEVSRLENGSHTCSDWPTAMRLLDVPVEPSAPS